MGIKVKAKIEFCEQYLTLKQIVWGLHWGLEILLITRIVDNK